MPCSVVVGNIKTPCVFLISDVETSCNEEKHVREKFVALVAAVSVSVLKICLFAGICDRWYYFVLHTLCKGIMTYVSAEGSVICIFVWSMILF